MVAANGHIHNGNPTNGVYPPCPSDYPEPDLTSTLALTKAPGWKSQFPAFTHNMGWIDPDGNSHSMTLRSDDLALLMRDVKMLRAMIRASKEKGKEKEATTDSVPAESGNIPVCPIHHTVMERRQSRRTGGHYWAHKTGIKDLCFGKARA